MVTRRSLLLAPLVALATAMSAITGVGVGAADTNYHPAAGWAQSLIVAGERDACPVVTINDSGGA